MKQRFSSLDVKIIAKELSSTLCSLRLANAYDLSSRIFLLKFAKPNSRHSLVIDSGFKCYLTNFTRTTTTAPSHFTSRLRKFLRSRRATSIQQIGTDRILEFQFSDGYYRLYLEFYAGGNIILTDSDLTVIALLRNVPESKGLEGLRIGSKYELVNRQNAVGSPPLTAERVRNGIASFLQQPEIAPDQPRKKGKPKPGEAVRQAVSAAVTEFSPMLIDSVLHSVGFDLTVTPNQILENEATFDQLMVALKEAASIYAEISGTEISPGFIVAKAAKHVLDVSTLKDDVPRAVQEGGLKYDEFHPFEPAQFKQSNTALLISHDSFNAAVDEFFSSVESQRLETRLTEKEEGARRKLENARLDHERRIDGLQTVQELNTRKAQAIEANLHRVQEAQTAVNSLLAQGMDWQNIARLIELEQGRQNVVAGMIKLPLKFYENTITLLLDEDSQIGNEDFESSETESEASVDEDDYTSNDQRATRKSAGKADPRLQIDIDLGISPWSNARQYYDQKRSAAVKEQKTVESSVKALKSAERKIGADLKKGLQQEKDVMRAQRAVLWFEKFIYFISSEGYLVLGGKDAQQNDILYKRHLKKGDVYIHADLDGATSIVVKNKYDKASDPIPPGTLSQAGALAVSTSSAWDSKAVMSAWWVHAEEVSKTMPNGDLLRPGDFHIKGEKNFLPPAQLLLGFALMFRISDASKARHLKHRIVEDDEGAVKNKVKREAVSPDDGSNDLVQNDVDHNEYEGPDLDVLPDSIEDLQVSEDEGIEDESNEVKSDWPNPLQPQEFSSDQGMVKANVSTNENQPDPGIDVSESAEAIEEAHESHKNDPQQHSFESPQACESILQDPEEGDEGAEVNEDEDEGAVESQSIDLESKEAPSNNITLVPSEYASTAPTPKVKATPQTQQLRGKHGKRQKQKNKYAHQDDEDRELAMRLLGSAAAHTRSNDDSADKEAKEKQAAEQKERRRRQHAQAAEKSKAAEEARRRRFEEGFAEDEPDDQGDVPPVDLESYVGAPLPGDEILGVLVMCGPWDAIGSRCRWKAKLQPGTVKKGKAVKEILTRWNALSGESEKKKRPGAGAGNETMIEEDEIRRREAELVRGIRDVEVIGVVPVGKVRVVLGAGEKGGGAGRGGKGGGRGGKGRGNKGSKR